MLNIILTILSFNPQFIKEAEIKHGRVAMLSSIAIPALDTVNKGVLGVNYISSLDVSNQLTALGLFGCLESIQMYKAFDFPREVSDWFNLKEDHVPGEYNFDPLNISTDTNKDKLKNNEMFVGRVAMLAVSAEMLKEICTKQTIF